jgi:hypothetical protein
VASDCASGFCNGVACQFPPGCGGTGCPGDTCSGSCGGGACINGVCPDPLSTCREIHATFPNAGSGFFALSLAGAGGPVIAYCDMTFDDGTGAAPGGWTLIEVTSALDPPAALNPGQVVPLSYGGNPAYLATAAMQNLATLSQQVSLRSPPVGAGAQPTEWIASLVGSPAITNLGMGQIIDQLGDNPASPGSEQAFYVGPMVNAGLDFTCDTSSQQYPSLYWSCGNPSGLDLQATVSTWQYQTPNTAFEVYVR